MEFNKARLGIQAMGIYTVTVCKIWVQVRFLFGDRVIGKLINHMISVGS
jgi:hypothetical protein